ncbi:MAG: tRNA uridine-5-carboxymethylaminomethyl(34) synthesis GTPase MnmE [Candidatus Margulisbacteria bacterium]|nr:tRNA uridine-5-carboxymethylaminomethyl(34) synthesis GTPase MnmE [Candidatus Margulisiibacteriota bacterium]
MNNTIAAIATPPGTGGVAIVRISGPDAFAVAAKISSVKKFDKNTIKPCVLFELNTKTIIDKGLLSVFEAPNSYTGEDVVEINCHGSYYLTQKLLTEVLKAGARLAEAGEFTKRAFLAGKLGLTQVEAVADTISAGSELSLSLALRHLEGDVQQKIRQIRGEFLQILSEIEAALDYPDEIDDPPLEKIRVLLKNAQETFARLLEDSARGLLIKSGAVVALAGRPNTGKSSLFNALLQHNKAIVTAVPGTTRDALEAEAQIGGLRVTLVDTAGLRETQDTVEKLGVERSRAHLQTADLVLAVFDAASGAAAEDQEILEYLRDRPHLRVANKMDLSEKVGIPEAIPVSAKTGQNLDLLAAKILEKLDLRRVDFSKNIYISSLRQKDRLIRAAQILAKTLDALEAVDYLDVLAPYLKEIVAVLGEITGDAVSDEIIEQIFANFCVGK